MRDRVTRVASVAALLTLAAGGAWAQGVLVPRPDVREWPFAVKSLRVTGSIADATAEITVEQTFVNNSSVEQEGTYLFPLPEGSTVTSFSLRAGDRVIEGRVLGKDEARSVYESIVRRRRDPALLEFLGSGAFRASVFPIPAHGERALTIRYAEVLKPVGGVWRWIYPLSTGRFSARPLASAAVSVRVRTTAPLKTVYSPSHDVSVRRPDERTATISWESRVDVPERDLTVYYGVAPGDVGLATLTYDPPGKDGYFLLVAAPRAQMPAGRYRPKHVVFVLDRTGSMQASGKLDQARAALHHCLGALRPEDRFGLITFNEGADLLSRQLLAATKENVDRAHRFIDAVEASGGTNIAEALATALALVRTEPGPRKMVVFLTDGLPTVGETNPERILEQVRNENRAERVASAFGRVSSELNEPHARIFTFGVGYDVNVPLLDRIAAENGGDSDTVRPQESIEGIVSAFFAKVGVPVLADLRLEVQGADVYDVFPRRMPDLFAGGQIVVAGRYRGSGPAAVRLVGRIDDREEAIVAPKALGGAEPRSSLVPRIWAARKIGYLLDQVRLNANPEVIDEIVRLSRDYGIITPYTSYLADERQDGIVRPGVGGDRRAYTLDAATVAAQERESALELRAMVSGREETGAIEAHRSLNAAGLQRAARAPAGGQGGFGGGLRPGAGQSVYLGALEGQDRRKASVDFHRAADLLSAPQGGRRAEAPLYRQVQEVARVQAVAGRVFYRRGGVWFDNGYHSGQSVLRVRAASEAHLQLVRARPELARFAGVGDEVVIVAGRVAVQFGREGKETLTEAEIREATSG